MVKMARYVELSKKFSKGLEDILTDDQLRELNNSNRVTFSNGGTGSITMVNGFGLTLSHSNTNEVENKTKSEILMEKFKLVCDLVDEYDEYISLRDTLDSYFKELTKLNS